MFDIIVAIVLAAFIIGGLRKGFFHESLGLIGLVGGVIAGVVGANTFGRDAESFLPGLLGKEPISFLVIFIVFFVVFYFASRLLAFLLKALSEKFFLGWLNKLLGSILGGLKGAIIIGLLLHGISFMPFGKDFGKSQKDTIFYKPLHSLVPLAYKILGNPEKLPDKMKEIVKDNGQEIKDAGKKLEKTIDQLDKARELMDE